eukprot:TRINITY_DN12473_c0_g2_i2.p1 TRINITY_DN12473_c0_g2~~TRINITY_DN12473_c0_g2_i2.p1  ORF type:complete len:604 (+),score=128.22 TRINITY_DN12473_c0_g2_i2:3-1814(+)
MAAPHRELRLFASRQTLKAAAAAASIGSSLYALINWVRHLQAKAKRHARFLQLAHNHAPRTLQRHRDEDAPERVVVIGAGVSGLALAWYLKQLSPSTEVVVLEASEDVGGNIQTASLGPGSAIELGPRSLRTTTKSAKVALQVIYMLGLKDKIRFANKATRARRYVFDYDRQRLEEMPSSLLKTIRFAIKHRLPSALLTDLSYALVKIWSALFVSTSNGHVLEGGSFATVHEFFRSHFSRHFATQFASALVHGIFSGSSQQLLLKYAFPAIWQSQVAYDSVIVGALLDPILKLAQCYDDTPDVDLHIPPEHRKDFNATLTKARKERVASLEGGLATLTQRLAAAAVELGVDLRLSTKVTQLRKTEANIIVKTDAHDSSRADVAATVVASTLPPAQLTGLLESSVDHLELSAVQHRRAQAAIARLHTVTSLSLAVITLVFEGQCFEELVNTSDAQPGFGFLMPASKDRGLVLGVVYDSCVFPELAGQRNGVFTVMLGGAEPKQQASVETMDTEVLQAMAMETLNHRLGVVAEASSVHVTKWIKAIPQFDAAYSRARSGLQQLLRTHMPWLFVTGKAFGSGVGVNDCIMSALATAKQIHQSISSS